MWRLSFLLVVAVAILVPVAGENKYQFAPYFGTQARLYTVMSTQSTGGFDPIFFPESNAGKTKGWSDACFEACLQRDHKFVGFFRVQEGTYCETYTPAAARNPYVTKFNQNNVSMLYRRGNCAN